MVFARVERGCALALVSPGRAAASSLTSLCSTPSGPDPEAAVALTGGIEGSEPRCRRLERWVSDAAK